MIRSVGHYFNDGEECVFRANRDFIINGVDCWGETEEEWTKEHGRLQGVVDKAMATFQDDDLEELFGDHVKVIVERGKEPVKEEYEHD